jgi:hypothetical protein
LPDSLQTAQADKLRSDKHLALLEAGIVTTSQIQRELQAGEEYQFNDEDIEALENMEEPNMFEEPVEFADRYINLTANGMTHDEAIEALS